MDAPTTPPRVFISYARADGEGLAKDLRARLEGSGIPLWQDRANLEGGRDWWLQITAALDRVDFLVWLMTPAAMRSAVVRKEWRYARQQGVTVYPVKSTAVLDFQALPRWMRDLHFYDLEHEWTKFVRDLERSPVRQRVPMMADELPEGFVARSGELAELAALLVDTEREDPIPALVAVCGAGGFGKTTLATALCHDERIQEAFDDGIVWVRLGEHPGELIGRVEDLIETLAGVRPGFSSLQSASTRLSEVLADRDVLIVIDDVWNAAHLGPFVMGGPRCARLITTRNLDVLPPATTIVSAGAMRPQEASALVGSGLPQASDPQFGDLAERLGGWPLLLRLVNGVLRERVDHHRQPLMAALDFVTHALERRGLTAFDARTAEARDQAIEKTMAVSLELLTPEEQDRYRDLAIFPEGPVPICAVEQLWGETGQRDRFDTEDLCLHLARLSLLVRFDLELNSIELHDALRRYLIRRLGTAVEKTHDALLRGYAKLAPSGWANGPDDGYFFQRLGFHLAGAGQIDALSTLLTAASDWTRTQFAATHGDAAYRSDVLRVIELSADPRSAADVEMLCELYTALQVVGERTHLYEDDELRVLVYLGREAEALNFARLRGDAAERGLGLVTIATTYDDHARVNTPLLDESERIARGVEDVDQRSQVLDVVSGAWILARNLAHARRVAQDIPDPAIRARAVARVGLALASTSQDAPQTLQEAIEIADSVADIKRRNETLVDVAATVLEAGDLALSRIVARRLPHAEHALMLQRVVVRLTDADEATLADTVAEALAVIAKLAHAEDQAAAYTSLGLALAEAGRTASAVEVLTAARSAAHAIATTDFYEAIGAIAAVAMIAVSQDGFFIEAARALDRVGHALVQAGRVDDAEAVFADARHELAGVANVEQRDAALARIGTRPIAGDAKTESDTLNAGQGRDALALARAGKLTEATAVLEESVRAREGALVARDGALRTLVASFAELGDLPTALALSEAIADPSERARACCSRLEAAARLADPAAAKRAFDQVLSAARCETTFRREQLLAEIALRLYGAELCAEAQAALAFIIDDAGEKGADLTLYHLADALIDKSFADEAAHVVSLIRDSLWKEPATARLEHHHADGNAVAARILGNVNTGRLQEASDLARTVSGDYARIKALAALGVALARADHVEEAGAIVAEIGSDSQSDYLAREIQVEIAVAHGRRGQLDAALAAAHAVDFDWDRARVFAMLAPSLVKSGREDEAKRLLLEGLTLLPNSFLDVKRRVELLGHLIDGASKAMLIEPALRAAAELDKHEQVESPDKWNPAGQILRYDRAEEAEQAKNSRTKALRALGAALIEAERVDDAERVAAALRDTELAAAVRRDGALRLVQKSRIATALAATGRQDVDQWIGALASWAPALDKIERGLARSVLANVVRIIAWIRSDWAPIESVLRR